MAAATLSIDLTAICANWRALAAKSAAQMAAVVKADAYGLGVAPVAMVLARAGARHFFVANCEEGAALRKALGAGPDIYVFSGHMAGDAPLIADHALIPLLNAPEQMARHREAIPSHAYGFQLDTGMSRLGLSKDDWNATRALALPHNPRLVVSHLACADTPDHPMNAQQLDAFIAMTSEVDAPCSLAATGGILLGRAYHFHMTRPGIGLYGGAPFADAKPVVRLSVPVIQLRHLAKGDSVGYGGTWQAQQPARIATLAAGYADGIYRHLAQGLRFYHGTTPCPAVGRISMDTIGVDITHLPDTPLALDLLNREQTIDSLAAVAGTINHEILTSLGARYQRRYIV
ncbi:MAG: alanine racemase [Rhodobacteraceae bacterium]|nr:alanine racemase [Paracoccaceae bacterium]